MFRGQVLLILKISTRNIHDAIEAENNDSPKNK